MEINDIRLSPELVATLYPEGLIDPSSVKLSPVRVAGPAQKKAVAPYPFLGKNRRSVCFLVSSADHEFLSEAEQLFLDKILAACKLTQDDIALINTFRHPLDLPALKEQFRPRIIFLWGRLSVADTEFRNLPDLTVSSLDDFLVVPVFESASISGSDPGTAGMKQKLWALLKKLFNL